MSTDLVVNDAMDFSKLRADDTLIIGRPQLRRMSYHNVRDLERAVYEAAKKAGLHANIRWSPYSDGIEITFRDLQQPHEKSK